MDEVTPVAVPGGRDQNVSGELLRGLRAGSSHAWARLYDQLAPGIHRFATSSLADPEAAEDVVVETLAHAARDIARFDPTRASLTTWIYAIARHRVLAELRWSRRRKSVPAWAQVSFEDVAELADSPDPGARADARLDAQRRIGELPGLLSDRETELLTLSAIDEIPVREIGRVVGCSEQAAHSALHRARQKVRRTDIEGTLMVATLVHNQPCSHWFSGSRDWRAGDALGINCELSPVSDEVAYDWFNLAPEVQSGHIWKAKRDGSEAINLTEAAGLRGVNRYPRWSPDGTLLAFVHFDNTRRERAGPGEAWVMKADGSGARKVAPEGRLLVSKVRWSADGSRLDCGIQPGSEDIPESTDLWGRRVQVLPELGEWSPDGSRLALSDWGRGEVKGEPGWWRRLTVMEADGSARTVVFEQFITDAELYLLARPADGLSAEWWAKQFAWWSGPYEERWSPAGDKIAFLAMLPFSPHGWRFDAWVYDLVTRRLTKITNEPAWLTGLSWR